MRLLAAREVGDVGRTRHVVFRWIRGRVTTCLAVFPWTAFTRIYRSRDPRCNFRTVHVPPGAAGGGSVDKSLDYTRVIGGMGIGSQRPAGGTQRSLESRLVHRDRHPGQASGWLRRRSALVIVVTLHARNRNDGAAASGDRLDDCRGCRLRIHSRYGEGAGVWPSGDFVGRRGQRRGRK